MDSACLLPDEAGLEEDLWASEALASDSDDVPIRELICFLLVRALRGLLHLSVEVQSNVCELFLDVTDNFTLRSGGEGVSTLSEDLHQILGEISSSKIETENGVRQSIALVDRHGVRDAVSRVHDNT